MPKRARSFAELMEIYRAIMSQGTYEITPLIGCSFGGAGPRWRCMFGSRAVETRKSACVSPVPETCTTRYRTSEFPKHYSAISQPKVPARTVYVGGFLTVKPAMRKVATAAASKPKLRSLNWALAREEQQTTSARGTPFRNHDARRELFGAKRGSVPSRQTITVNMDEFLPQPAQQRNSNVGKLLEYIKERQRKVFKV